MAARAGRRWWLFLGLAALVVAVDQTTKSWLVARLAPGESVERTFEIAVRPWPGAGEVNAFRIVAQASNEKHPDVFPNNFLLPVQKP